MGAGTAERSSGLFVSPPLLLLSDRKQTGERTIGNICFPRRPVRRNHVGFSLTLHERNSRLVKLSKEGIKKASVSPGLEEMASFFMWGGGNVFSNHRK